jgi:hypothetical protein
MVQELGSRVSSTQRRPRGFSLPKVVSKIPPAVSPLSLHSLHALAIGRAALISFSTTFFSSTTCIFIWIVPFFISQPTTNVSTEAAMSTCMENTDWDFVLQFVSEPLEIGVPHVPEKPVAERTNSAVPMQVPTPPVRCLAGDVRWMFTYHNLLDIVKDSFTASPADSPAEEDTLVSVSTTFFPGAQIHSLPPDIVLLSSDSVFFYVHTHVLHGASENGFSGLLPPTSKAPPGQLGPVVMISESSTILNIILHAVYDMACSHYSPSFESLSEALSVLTTYGLSVKRYASSSTPLHSLLLSHAPLYPLELYALAASYDLYELAVSTSSHLLSFSLASLTDEMADRIGARYLKRLFFLHFGRADALKRLLLPPPHPHAPTTDCDFTEQKRLTRAWALASAYLAWDARPGMSHTS